PGAISFSAISGATSASYTTPSTTIAQSGTKYEATFTNAFGSTTTTAATLTVNAPASPTPIDSGRYLYGVACPSTSQCTADDNEAQEVTHNPNQPGSLTPGTIPRGYTPYVSAVSCPSTGQCTAIIGYGYQVTFNPKKPGSLTPIYVHLYNAKRVACPSTSQCTAVNNLDQQVTFDPNVAGKPTPTTTPDAAQTAVACPSTNQCTAVGYPGYQVTDN